LYDVAFRKVMFMGQPHCAVASHIRASGQEMLDHTACGV
jgi:hypothetical protein